VSHRSGQDGEYSRRLFDLCEEVTPVVERRSIDEGFLDLGPCGYKTSGEVEAAVRRLQEHIWEKLQIPVSFGLAANKLVAAIASKLRKPRGFVVVPPGTEAVLEREEIPRFLAMKVSPHQIDLREVLALAELRGTLPAVTIALGLEPERMELGVRLSPRVEARLDRLVELAVDQLRRWGHECHPQRRFERGAHA
jgi:hydrogenase maturation protease